MLAGVALAVTALCWPAKRPPRALAILHGLLALAGFGVLIPALEGPPRGVASGTQGFGPAAAILLLLAAALGIVSVVRRWRHERPPGFWMGAHVCIAITGYVILAAYFLAG